MTSHNPFPPGSLVAGYFRDSGGDAQELSVPQQQAAFFAWCSANHLTPGQTLIDRLSTLEGEASLLQYQIANLERQLIAVCAQTTPADLDELRTTLLTSDHQTLQAILRGVIQKIIVDRQGIQLTGQLVYYHPP